MSIVLTPIQLTDTFGVWVDRTNEVIAELADVPVLGAGANNTGDFELTGDMSVSGSLSVDEILPQNPAGDSITVGAMLNTEDSVSIQSVGLNGSALRFTNSFGTTTWSVETATDHSYVDITNGTNYLRLTANTVTGSGVTISDSILPDTITSNLTGDVTGNLSGNVTGNVTGNLSGNVTSTGSSSFATLSATNASVTNFTLGGSSVTSTAAELNKLDGVTWNLTSYNTLTASAAELNQLDNLTLGNVASLNTATVADFRSNASNKVLTTTNVWSAQDTVTLTDAATIAVNMSLGLNFQVTLGGNRVLGAPTNAKAGQRGRIKVIQDATGSRTLSFNSVWDFASGTTHTLQGSTSGEYDILYYDVVSPTSIVISALGNVS